MLKYRQICRVFIIFFINIKHINSFVPCINFLSPFMDIYRTHSSPFNRTFKISVGSYIHHASTFVIIIVIGFSFFFVIFCYLYIFEPPLTTGHFTLNVPFSLSNNQSMIEITKISPAAKNGNIKTEFYLRDECSLIVMNGCCSTVVITILG